jgi:NAD(P)H dehydrogenase (quinone)
MTGVIAVTGVTGVLGRRVAERLLVAGSDVRIRLVVRDPGRIPQLSGGDIEVVANPDGYADGAGFTEALRGVHTLYLVSAAEAVDRLEQHRTAVAAAAAAGVRRIVYTSFVGARPDATFTLARRSSASSKATAPSLPPPPATGARASSPAMTWPTWRPRCCSTTPPGWTGRFWTSPARRR